MKKKIIIVFILLSIIASGCITVNIYQQPVKKYQDMTVQDTLKIESWY